MRKHSHDRPVARRSIEFRHSGGPSIPRLWRRRVRAATWPAFLPHVRITAPTDSREVAAHRSIGEAACGALAALLLGLTGGLILSGLPRCLPHAEFKGASQNPLEGVFVIGLSMVLLGLGAKIPQRFALRISTHAWRRFVARGEVSAWAESLIGAAAVDRPLHWIVLSVIALAGGILTALLPLTIRLCVTIRTFMLDHFLWSPASEFALQLLTWSMALAAPLGALGLALARVHCVGRADGKWNPRATGWLLSGAGFGTFAVAALPALSARAELLFVVAALPALVAVLIAAVPGSSTLGGGDDASCSPTDSLPIWSDRWPVLLRASIVAVAGSGAVAVAVWGGGADGTAIESGKLTGCMVLAMGLGVLAGCHVRRTALRSIGGFGVACVLAGVVVAITAAWAVPPTLGRTTVLLVPSCAGMVAIGFATAYGCQALMNRVAGRASAGAAIVALTLATSALSLGIGVWLKEYVLNAQATLVAIGLLILGLGGVLIIHEPKYSPRLRRVRLLMVFVSIATMILLGWLAPRWWVQRTDSQFDSGGIEPRSRTPPDHASSRDVSLTTRNDG